MIRQIVKTNRKTIKASGSSDDLAPLIAIMAGVVEVYDSKGTGGADAVYPAQLNTLKFSVGDRTIQQSASVTIPHVKPTKYLSDISKDFALFDAGWTVSTSAKYASGLYNKEQNIGGGN